MKKYKDILSKGFENRNFEIIQIENDGENIPWWIEEMWTIKPIKSDLREIKLIVTFLTERSWESGTKLVDEISISKSRMKNYLDKESELLNIDMRKGIFEQKISLFWDEFENKIKTLANK